MGKNGFKTDTGLPHSRRELQEAGLLVQGAGAA